MLRLCDELAVPAATRSPRPRCGREPPGRGSDRPGCRCSTCRSLRPPARLSARFAVRLVAGESWPKSVPAFRQPHGQTTPAQVLADPSIQIVSIASYDNCHHQQVHRGPRQRKACLRRKAALPESTGIRRHQGGPGPSSKAGAVLQPDPPQVAPLYRAEKTDSETAGFGRHLLRRGGLSLRPASQNRERLAGRNRRIFRDARRRDPSHRSAAVVIRGAVRGSDGDGKRDRCAGSGFRYNDMVVSLLRFRSGAIGKVSANFGCVHPHFHALTIYGTKATYVNGAEAALLYTSREPDDLPQAVDDRLSGNAQGGFDRQFRRGRSGRPPAGSPGKRRAAGDGRVAGNRRIRSPRRARQSRRVRIAGSKERGNDVKDAEHSLRPADDRRRGTAGRASTCFPAPSSRTGRASTSSSRSSPASPKPRSRSPPVRARRHCTWPICTWESGRGTK